MEKESKFIDWIQSTKLAGRIEKLIKSKYGPWVLFIIAFIDSVVPVIPIIMEPFLVTAVLANRARARLLTTVTVIGSVLGGVVAYVYAFLLKDLLLGLLSPELRLTLEDLMARQGSDTFMLAVAGAVTPIPYTVVAWAVALTGGSLIMFTLGSITGRAFRYGIVGWCTYKFGSLALTYIKRSIIISSLVFFVLAAIYIWYKM